MTNVDRCWPMTIVDHWLPWEWKSSRSRVCTDCSRSRGSWPRWWGERKAAWEEKNCANAFANNWEIHLQQSNKYICKKEVNTGRGTWGIYAHPERSLLGAERPGWCSRRPSSLKWFNSNLAFNLRCISPTLCYHQHRHHLPMGCFCGGPARRHPGAHSAGGPPRGSAWICIMTFINVWCFLAFYHKRLYQTNIV